MSKNNPMNPEYRAMNAAIHLSVGAVWVLTQDVDVNPEIHQRGDGFLDHHLFRPRCSAFVQEYSKTCLCCYVFVLFCIMYISPRKIKDAPGTQRFRP